VAAARPPPPTSVHTAVPTDPGEELEELESEAQEIDGAWLRRSRLRRGIDLEVIAGVTKINPTYLRFLEDERYGDLPAPVYVRGFVAAYASCLGVDSRRVASAYMKRYEARRSEGRRGRFF
jgi:cytoskeletal protein RodZ